MITGLIEDISWTCNSEIYNYSSYKFTWHCFLFILLLFPFPSSLSRAAPALLPALKSPVLEAKAAFMVCWQRGRSWHVGPDGPPPDLGSSGRCQTSQLCFSGRRVCAHVCLGRGLVWQLYTQFLFPYENLLFCFNHSSGSFVLGGGDRVHGSNWTNTTVFSVFADQVQVENSLLFKKLYPKIGI